MLGLAPHREEPVHTPQASRRFPQLSVPFGSGPSQLQHFSGYEYPPTRRGPRPQHMEHFLQCPRVRVVTIVDQCDSAGEIQDFASLRKGAEIFQCRGKLFESDFKLAGYSDGCEGDSKRLWAPGRGSVMCMAFPSATNSKFTLPPVADSRLDAR